MNVYESLDRLQEDADAQSQKEDTIEEGTNETSSLPTKGKILARGSLSGNLEMSMKNFIALNRELTISADSATMKLTRSFSYKQSVLSLSSGNGRGRRFVLHSGRHQLKVPASRLETPLEK